MKTGKYIVLAMVIVSLVAANTAWSETRHSVNSEEIVDLTDLDGDDRIDIEEYHNRITDVYFFLDTDKDGKLTVVEIKRSYPNLDAAVINKVDVNKDTIITIYEFRYVLYKDFDGLDKNKDGGIDQQEMKTAVEEK